MQCKSLGELCIFEKQHPSCSACIHCFARSFEGSERSRLKAVEAEVAVDGVDRDRLLSQVGSHVEWEAPDIMRRLRP